MSWDPESESNPLTVADEIDFFVSAGLGDGSVSFRSAFLLNQEAIRIGRLGYLQPAWGHRLSFRSILKSYMQRLVALATLEETVAKVTAAWLDEDAAKLDERREHYVVDRIVASPGTEPSRLILQELSRIRRDYERLPFDAGPYHNEVFPYDEFAPEDVLLSGDLRPFPADDLEPDVERLLVSLSTGRWA